MNPTAPEPLIEMQNVTVSAMRDDSFVVLKNVDWKVAPGEFWVLGGPQYSGKTDLLMLAAGLVSPVEGSCRWMGMENVSTGDARLAGRLRMGLVFQGGQLFNRMSIAENVALPIRYRDNLEPDRVAPEVAGLLDAMELSFCAGSSPMQVAANWRSRVALARALILKPEILLLDNPLSGLGGRHRAWWQDFLDQLWKGHPWLDNRPITLVVTADDFGPWQSSSRRFALLHDGRFQNLGFWMDVARSSHPALPELLPETP